MLLEATIRILLPTIALTGATIPGVRLFNECKKYGQSMMECENMLGIKPRQRIPADFLEYPHMVLIGFSKESNASQHMWNCGGSLITESWVLTAGHCLTDTSAGPPRRMRVGTTSFEHEEVDDLAQERGVGILKPHPEYKPPSKYNDIALLKSDTPFELNRHVRIACLPWDKNLTVHNATATGFGKTAYESRSGSQTLMKVDIDIIDSTICNSSFKSMIRRSNALQHGIVESQLCAGDMRGGKDTCQGDSGGPLQVLPKDIDCVTSFPLYQIVGVTSFGRFCGFSNSPGVYTRVSHYVPWIESVVWPG